MEFKSQICTSRSQSEKLLVLGLKKETADMLIMSYSTKQDIIALPWSESGGWTKDNSIPAWSLHRLIELLGGNVAIDDFAIEWAYDTVIDHIAFDIRHNQFNHEYLAEKL